MIDFWNIKIECDDISILKHIRNHFSVYAKNFRFSPAYQMGRWDGRIRFFKDDCSLPFGLLTEFLKFKFQNYPDSKMVIEQEVKDKFKTFKELEYKWDLKYEPRWYQEECIRTACERKSGIFKCPTASGKSLIIAYIGSNLLYNELINKVLIVVPQLNLITQFKNDLEDYGINPDNIGEVYSKKKEFDKKYVISTWQSLRSQKEFLDDFDCIIIDECHQGKAREIQEILKSSKAEYRFGVTGTLPDEEIDLMNIKSYLGPVLKEYSMSMLRDEGYLSKCMINLYDIHYKVSKFYGEFDEVRDQIFKNPFRMKLIKKILEDQVKNDTLLILVNFIDKEGYYLKDVLEKAFPDKKIIFLEGSVKKDKREEVRLEACNDGKDLWIISTYPIFQAGVNIPNLRYVMLAAPYKSKIRVLQSIGRALRPHKSKEANGSQIYDFIDNNNKWFPRHAKTRKLYYAREDFPVKEILVKE